MDDLDNFTTQKYLKKYYANRFTTSIASALLFMNMSNNYFKVSLRFNIFQINIQIYQ